MLLVETRDGAYIWHMATDDRVLVNANVETSLDGRRGIRSFVNMGWDLGKNQLLGIAVEHQENVTAYDVNSGQVMGSYPLSVLDKAYTYGSDPQLVAPTPLPNIPLEGINGFTTGIYDTMPSSDSSGDIVGCGNLRGNYIPQSQQFVLIDHTTRNIISMLGEDTNPVSDVNWSPGCKYIYAAVSGLSTQKADYDNAAVDDYALNGGYSVVFWDVQSGKQLKTFSDRPTGTKIRVSWSPNGDHAIVRTPDGYFIYELLTGRVSLLTYPAGSNKINTYYSVYWDYSRGQILITGWYGVIAFDMRTGAGRYSLARTGSFSVTNDNRMLYSETYSDISVWNLDTLQHNLIDIVVWGSYVEKHGAFSSDGRYFVTGYEKIRVWDLQTPTVEAQAPTAVYEGSKTTIQRVRFVDNTTIETTDANGAIQRWNILSGEMVETG